MRADGGRAVEKLLASSGIETRSMRRRIRRKLEAHLARGDRENIVANLQLAVPGRIRPAWVRWSLRLWRLLPIIAGVGTVVSTRSWFVGASVYGWVYLAIVVASIVLAVARRRTADATALGELDRIRIMASHGDVAAALALWRKLERRGPTSPVIADAIADGACAIEQLAGTALATADREQLARCLDDMLPHLSAECAGDAGDALHRLEHATGRPVDN